MSPRRNNLRPNRAAGHLLILGCSDRKRAAKGKLPALDLYDGGEPEGDIVNCPSRLDKTGKEGLSGITCPVACQSRVAPRPKSGLQAQCGGGLENPWLGTEWCVPLNASSDRL